MTVADPVARSFMRHPADIPIEIDAEQASVSGSGQRLSDVGVGGLAFACEHSLPLGSIVRVRITIVRPPFETRGRVVWCQGCERHFDVGVQFVSAEAAFTVRMVEQICHIEHYRQEVRQLEGRQLGPEEAALEWVGKYAADFANPQ
ncbi:PilZ domain-containing protein [Candidatus Accumulibacter sp. ACC003]|uniref:PilZ domain-containing protein n=1 Tax=Candidatus Accumulibacter sp. ACC003 TaxID=2823334 RepID=UPI0025BE2BA5|nr:PilZ domain-containing protein [Candidatus Accumulibacter sp. ACC003]